MKLKVFSKSGEIIYSTDSEDMGYINKQRYFHEIVAKGNAYTMVVQKNTKSLEDQIVTADVVETYVPIMDGDTFIGAFEIYYDITLRKQKLDEVVYHSSLTVFAMMLSFLVVIIIILFKADRNIAKRKQAEEQIKASLKEKEVLLKEIHHRIKNNLQVISSLLNLQSGYIIDKDAIEMFKESQNRVKSMALIHEKLYQSKDLARIDFAEYIRNLTNYLFRSYGVTSNRIKLKKNVDDVFLGLDTAIPCGLIINELVSNSLKHAFPDGKEGEIHICLFLDNDKFTLIVRDNGVGFPKDLDFRNTESLGLQLVITLVEQLEGTIDLKRSGGTEFKIIFTELKYKERS